MGIDFDDEDIELNTGGFVDDEGIELNTGGFVDGHGFVDVCDEGLLGHRGGGGSRHDGGRM